MQVKGPIAQRGVLALVVALAGAAGCLAPASGDGSSGPDAILSDASVTEVAGSDAGTDAAAAEAASRDAASSDARLADDAGPADSGAAPDAGGDGAPTRQACTSRFGSALSATFGRLDGVLVSIVPRSTSACNGDPDHLHLQLRVNGAEYDVAVNIASSSASDVLLDVSDRGALAQPWSEGWHTGDRLDYVADLGLASADFGAMTSAGLEQRLLSELADVNHLSVYATGYGPTGAHLVHRNRTGQDGALVLHPLSAAPRYLLFRFASQRF